MIIVTGYVMVCNELCVRWGIVFEMRCLECVINREGVELLGYKCEVKPHIG